MLFTVLCLLPMLQSEKPIQLTLLAKGASAKIGYYSPQRAALSAQAPKAVVKPPIGLTAPMYGVLPIGGGEGIAFVLDEPEGQPARLFVDSNANGDFSDDPAAEWTAKTNTTPDGNSTTMHNGSAQVDIGEPGKPLPVNLLLYRFDKTDPKREALKATLLYYRDYAYEGEIELAGKRMKAMLCDEMARGDFRGVLPDEAAAKKGADSGARLLLDVNANGKFDSRGESFDVRKPFNIGGTTFELADLARSGASFRIVKSQQSVAEIPTPPDHSVGKRITAFTAADTDGKPVKFPADYAGKVVLLDFWATWCQPCMKEMPNVVSAYAKHHAAGFEILGISLDDEKSILKMPDVMKGANMNWRQIADGKGWSAELALKYAINSIPATFLVDGTTGEILGADLRGEALDAALAKALGKPKPKQ